MMVNVVLASTAGRKSGVFDDSTTVRSVLEQLNVDYSGATNCLDGVRLDTAGMNKTLAQHGVTENCRISSIVKADNAAPHIDVNGSAAVLVSDIPLKDWKLIKKYAPEKLVETDEDGNPIFRVDVLDAGAGSVSKYGIAFGKRTNNGKATATILISDKVANVKEEIVEQMGPALLKLKDIEAGIDAAKAEIEARKTMIEGMVRVAE